MQPLLKLKTRPRFVLSAYDCPCPDATLSPSDRPEREKEGGRERGSEKVGEGGREREKEGERVRKMEREREREIQREIKRERERCRIWLLYF
jgi:hypothetical protein